MIDADARARIRRLFFAEHWKVGTIAPSSACITTRSVARDRGRAFRSRGGVPRPSLLDPYKRLHRASSSSSIRELRATRLFEMIAGARLRRQRVVVRRYVRTVRPVPKAEAFFRLVTLPGEQAQVDWATSARSASARPSARCRAS